MSAVLLTFFTFKVVCFISCEFIFHKEMTMLQVGMPAVLLQGGVHYLLYK